jgi:Cobalamin-independent synthase, Catalytic domain
MNPARRALTLLPPCATTGVGSLPHTQLELALQVALHHDLAFLPQLPAQNPSELMIPQALEGLPGLTFDAEGVCTIALKTWEQESASFGARLEAALSSGSVGDFEPSAAACRALQPFLWEVEHRKLPFAKVQLAGPATVRWVARLDGGQPASSIPALDQQIYRLALARTTALVKAVRRAGATAVIFLDEPGLYALDMKDVRHRVVHQELKMLVVALQREGALVGLHCCSNTDWRAVLELGLDILSIDARLSLDAVLEERAAFWRFLADGSTLALGIVPTDLKSAYVLPELVESVEASLRATTPGQMSFEGVLARLLLSPACGLGMRSVSDAERIIAEVRQAQRLLKDVVAGAGAAFPA